MAKLFEEVLSGAASGTADIIISFLPHHGDGHAAAPTSNLTLSIDSQVQREASPQPQLEQPSATRNEVPANLEAVPPGCFTPGDRRCTESGGSSHDSPRTDTRAVADSPNRNSSPGRQVECSPERATQASPPSLRCHSLVLRAQPSLLSAIHPNFGREPSPCSREKAEAASEPTEDTCYESAQTDSLGDTFGSERSSVATAEMTATKMHEVAVTDEPEVFLEMLKFVYLNTLQIDSTNVKALLLIADKYDIEDIVRHCLQWMQDHFTANIFFNFLTFRLSRFQQLLWQSLLLALRSRRNFTLVTEDPDGRWEQLPVSFVEALLSSDELPVVSEAEVLHLLARWASGALARQDDESLEGGSVGSPLMPPRQPATGSCIPKEDSYPISTVEPGFESHEGNGSYTDSYMDSGGEGASSGSSNHRKNGTLAPKFADGPRSEGGISGPSAASGPSNTLSKEKEAHEQRRKDMLKLLRTFRRSNIAVKISDLEPILQILQLSGLFCGKAPRENAAMDPGFVIYRGVAGVNVATPFGHGLTQPDVVTHAWKGGSVSLGSHDSVQQQDGFRPSCTTEEGVVVFPRLWVRIQCPSWSHREKRMTKSASGHVRHTISGPLQTEVAESVSSSPMSMMPVHEVPAAAPGAASTLKTMQSQSQDDWEIGRKPLRSGGPAGVPNISDAEKIDHKVICAVISGHMHHGIRIGQRERSSIYDIEDMSIQSTDEVCIGGTPTEVEFELQLTAQAPNPGGICQCRLAVLPAGAPYMPTEKENLMNLAFDASSEEPLHFHISSNHFDSNSSYSVALNWVLRPRARK